MVNAHLESSWTKVTFGEVVRQVKNKIDPQTSGLERYIAGEHMSTDDLRLRRWGKIGDDYLGPAFHMHFKPGQVLYGSRRTYLRKVAIPHFEGICANTTFVLEAKDPQVLLPELLPFIMQTEAFYRHSTEQSKGSVNPYVNFSDLAWWKFYLPSLEFQQEIVNLFLSTENLIERQRNIEEKIIRVFNSLFDDFLTQYWPIMNLEDAVTETQYGISSNAGDSGLYPILRMMNLEDGLCIENSLKYLDLGNEEFQTYRLEYGDVLFNRTNSYELVGRTGVYTLEGNHVFASYLIRIKTNPKRLDPFYLATYLNSERGRQQVLSFTTRGVSQSNVNAKNLMRIKIPLPPIEKQKKLLEQCQSLRNLLSETQERRYSTETIKRKNLATTLANKN